MNQTFARAGGAALSMLTLAMLAACQQIPASGPTAISYNDTQMLSTGALKDRLSAQLDSILSPAPAPPRWARHAGGDYLDNLWMATPPRRDEGADFCTYDLLRLQLAPVGNPGDHNSDLPNHVVGLASSAWFTPAPKGTTDCTGLEPTTVHYFESDDPINVWLDFKMLDDALTRLASPAPGYAISCEEDACTVLPKHLKTNTLTDITACRYAPAAGSCRHFSWREPDYFEMDIVYDTPALGRRIINVHIEPGIIVN